MKTDPFIRKWQKIFVALVIVLLVLIATSGMLMLILSNEPMYQARPLSHWLEVYSDPDVSAGEKIEARNAVLSIGTNALPYLLEAIRRESPDWRRKLRRHVADEIRTNEALDNFFYGDSRKATEAMMGFAILGSNANAAIPELIGLFNNTNALRTSQCAMGALSVIGLKGFPILAFGLANTNRPNRIALVYHISWMAETVGTNTVLPPLLNALNDQDPLVRKAASRVLLKLAPEAITNNVPQ